MRILAEILVLLVLCLILLEVLNFVKTNKLRCEMRKYLSNWQRNSETKNLVDIRDSLDSKNRSILELQEEMNAIKTNTYEIIKCLKMLSDGLIPVLGSDSVELHESCQLIESIVANSLVLQTEIVQSVESLCSIRKLLLNLSDQITSGDAEILQRAIIAYIDKVGKSKRTEHLQRASASYLKAIRPYCEQEYLEKLRDTIQQGS